MKTLHLNLKNKWFEMILSGEKTEEYREVTEHWVSHLFFRIGGEFKGIDNGSARRAFNFLKGVNGNAKVAIFQAVSMRVLKLKHYDTITFSNGYSKSRPQFEIKLIETAIGVGRSEWGAEPGVKYFVLKLGDIIKTENL